MAKPVYVTRPMLPPRDELNLLIEQVWDSGIVTNGGPLHNQLEARLRLELGVPTAALFNNGTTALLAAMKMLRLPVGAEIITTPFTFAATAHAIKWNNLEPVFADILPGSLTLDPEAVEKAITPKTGAILGVHVYGNVCQVDELQAIADRHGIHLLFDAAHAFGTVVDGRPIGTFGDGSVFSFHATKLFNTLEGGMVVTPKEGDYATLYNLRNFGIQDEESVIAVGINGKMNELQAAVGLLNLSEVANERNRRKVIREMYCTYFEPVPGVELPPTQHGVISSQQYFPIVIDEAAYGCSRNELYDRLKARDIFARKYFHPICTDFEPYSHMQIVSARQTPFVQKVKDQVLCLPFYGEMSENDVMRIIDAVVGDHIFEQKRVASEG